MKKFAILLSAISLFSCGEAPLSKEQESIYNTPSRYLEISSQFSQDQQQAIVDAMETWKVATGNILTYEVSIVDNIDILNIRPNHFVVYPYEPEKLGYGTSVIGLTFWNYIKLDYIPITLDPQKTGDIFRAVATHELGHAFHLQHYAGLDQAIMYAFVGNNYQVQCADISVFCNVWDCSIECTGLPNPAYSNLQLETDNSKQNNNQYIDDCIINEKIPY